MYENKAGTQRKIKYTCFCAFTLVEMLVVIAIIIVLASMMLPGLRSAYESSRSTLCMNNMKQIHIGTLSYADEYKGFLPDWKTWTPNLADMMELPYAGDFPTQKECNTGLFLCPSTNAPGNTSIGWWGAYSGQRFNTSYGPTLVAYFQSEVRRSQGGWQLYYESWRQNQTKRVVSVLPGSVILIEKSFHSVNWAVVMPASDNRPFLTNLMSTPAYAARYRHNNESRGNFLFIDGHVQSYFYGKQFTASWKPRD